MRLLFSHCLAGRALVAAAACLVGAPAFAQSPYGIVQTGGTNCPPPSNCCPPSVTYPMLPSTSPGMPPGTPPATLPGTVAPPATASAPSFGGETAGAGLGSSFASAGPNYIDAAIPQTMFRIRADAMYDDNRPDRAEFFYAKCGCTGAPNAKGPPLTESSVDAQELTGYLEYAPTARFSAFVEVPWRFINPEQNANNEGISDVNFGFKYALVYDNCQILTTQVRTFTPTGDPYKGLGTGNWTIEPALLYERQLSDKLLFFGELRDLIPLAPISDFTGNVSRYGLGVSYQAYDGCLMRVAPVAEFVGWTVLSGKELVVDNIFLNAAHIKDSAGDTIVNAKVGLRFNFGPADADTLLSHSDWSVSYGRALTGDVWYKDIVRLEYRLRF